jgi:hypothetical protein
MKTRNSFWPASCAAMLLTFRAEVYPTRRGGIILYVANALNNIIRKVSPAGTVMTLAGLQDGWAPTRSSTIRKALQLTARAIFTWPAHGSLKEKTNGVESPVN